MTLRGVLQTRRFSDTQAWADPVLGTRLRVSLTDKWFAVVAGDVGGFGAASDFTWQAYGGNDYQFNERWSLKVGYRALGVDYENSGFKFDVVQHGPLIGLGIGF